MNPALGPAERYPRGLRDGRQLPLAIGGGVLLGLLALYAWVAMTPWWAFYFTAAFMIAAGAPVVLKIAGSMERLLAFLFVLALQFNLSFNLVWERTKALSGGPQGINISLILILALAYWIAWGTRRVIGRARPWSPPGSFVLACLAFLGTSALSLVNAQRVDFSTYGLFYNLTLIIIALTAAHLCSSREGLRILWAAGLVLIAMQAAVLLAQRAANISFDMNGDVLANRSNTGRFGGTAGMAPANAATLLMVFLFFAERRLFSPGRRDVAQTATIFGLGALCLLLSLTRSCWIGFTGGSLYLAVRGIREGNIRLSRVMTIAAAGLVCLVVAWRPVHGRMEDNHSGAWEERWQLNYIDLEMIKAHPLLGVGLNNAYDSLLRYVPSFFSEYDWIYLAHNQFLHVTAETGLVGLVPFVGVLWLTVRRLRRSRGSGDPLLEDTVTCLLAGVWSMIWGMQLDFYSGMQMYVLLWFVLGASAGVTALCARERRAREAARSRTDRSRPSAASLPPSRAAASVA